MSKPSSTPVALWALALHLLLTLHIVPDGAQGFLLGHLDNPTVGPLSRGEEGHYRYAAVATNTDLCSEVGVEIMAKHGGSAVDAAIASTLCVGVTRPHSSGVAGGNFITVYDKASNKVVSIISREIAPAAATQDMFANMTGQQSQEGGAAIAIPGEIMGFWTAHQLYGRLPWKSLFQPAIRMADFGFPALPQLESAIQSKIPVFSRFPTLKAMVTNPATNTYYKEGEIIRLPALARTLTAIAEGGAAEFYNGSLADTMVKEIQDAGGIITKDDFRSYYSEVKSPLKLSIGHNLTAYAPPLPASGAIFINILNILKGYNMTSADISTNEKTILTYHRFIEAFKYAYSARTRLGSPDGEDDAFKKTMKELVANLTSPAEGEATRQLISDDHTFPWQHYNPSYHIANDHGTSQISVLAPNQDAVSITSTVNLFFGSKVVGPTSGLVYNNEMDDFSSPAFDNAFGVVPSQANFIKPGKRPLSSMSPSIVVDDVTGRPVLVFGSAGGTKITTFNAFLAGMTLWLGEDIKTVIDAPKIHHQLLPDVVVMTDNTPKWLEDGLKQKGHKTKFGHTGTPNGILQRFPGYILANADNAIVDGY